MKHKILVTLVVLMLSLLPMTAMAYDQSNPATINVRYTITTDTTFLVEIVSPETGLNFSAYKTEIGAEPDGQNAAFSIAWANITNGPTAQMTQTFKAKLGAANPTGVTTLVASDNVFSDAVTLSTTAQAPGGWYGVAPGSTVKAYFKIDTIGTAVTGTNTVIISAVP